MSARANTRRAPTGSVPRRRFCWGLGSGLGVGSAPTRRAWVGLIGAAVVVVGVGAPVAASPSVALGTVPLIECVATDNGDPELTAVTFAPAVVDTTDGPVTVAVTATAHDTGGPGPAVGLQTVRISVGRGEGELGWVRLHEDASGDWIGQLTVSPWLRGGKWRVDGALVKDKVGQQREYPNAAVVDASFTVNPAGDRTRPALTALSISPNSVDTTNKARRIRITARVRDESGVALAQVGLASRGGRYAVAFLNKKPGTANTYRGTAVIPRWIASDRWQVWFVYLQDRASNSRYYFTGGLARLGFEHSFAVVSRRDLTRPTLSTFRLSSAAVNVEDADQSVTVTARAKDTGSGVRRVAAAFRGANGVNLNVRLERVSGTPRDGIWRGTLLVAQCPAASGPLTGSVVVTDDRGHRTSYPTRELRRHHWSTTLRVVALPDALPPRAHVAPGSVFDVPLTGPVVVRFNEPVNGLTNTSGTVRIEEVEITGGEGPVITGTWDNCKTGAGAATDCLTGSVRKASFHPDTALEPGEFEPQYYRLDINPEHNLDVTDLAGNPFDRFPVYFFTTGP